MKTDPFDVVKDWIAVALMAVLGTGAVFLLARGSWEIISREHHPANAPEPSVQSHVIIDQAPGPDVETVPAYAHTVPPNMLYRGERRVSALYIGESCYVSMFGYETGTDRSIWLANSARCSGMKGSLMSIEVRRVQEGFEATIDGIVDGSNPLSEDSLKGSHTKVVRLIVRPKK